jgi:thiamine biosynthesis lipoprotein
MTSTQPTPAPPATRRRFRPVRADRPVTACQVAAMGTQVELLVVDAPSGALAHARARLVGLEARWSRFRPDSEISTLNHAAGQPVAVSPETFTLVTLGVLGWQGTGGRFDPTVLDALEAAGYDRTFEQLAAGREGTHPSPGPAPGLAGIALDVEGGTVTLPAGSRFDPGGIGKGYAADLVCGELRAAGAAGACVNVGGDLRVSGASPRGGPWVIAVPHPHRGQAATVELTEGAVATSSPLRRAWRAGGRLAHHLIDPRTGQPARTGILQATVVAGEAWRAEVAAKAAFLAGLPDGLDLVSRLSADALLIDQDGRTHLTAGLQQATNAAELTR